MKKRLNIQALFYFVFTISIGMKFV